MSVGGRVVSLVAPYIATERRSLCTVHTALSCPVLAMRTIYTPGPWHGNRSMRLHERSNFAGARKRLICFAYAHAPTKYAPNRRRVIVVGGGAAGLTAAWFAAQVPNVEVLILEKNEEAGRKILISGGTRCNVMPLHIDLDQDYFTESSKSALRAVMATWSLQQCKEWMEGSAGSGGLGLQLSLEESSAKYFPTSNKAADVRDALLQGCQRAGAHIRYGSSLQSLRHSWTQRSDLPAPSAIDRSSDSAGPPVNEQERQAGRWTLTCHDGSQHDADAVVLATGGLSFPSLGASDAGARALERLGHTLRPLYPALTPLKGPHPGNQQLAGRAAPQPCTVLTIAQDAQVRVQQSWLQPAQQINSASASSAFQQTAGVSLYQVQLQCEHQDGAALGSKRRGPKRRQAARQSMVFTHRGFSGPAVLDLSHSMVMAMERGNSLPILSASWTEDSLQQWEERLKGGGSGLVVNLLRKHALPQRLADALCQEVGIWERPLSELKREERQALLKLLCSYPLQCTGHEGYPKAEVTGGGVPLEQVDCSTLSSRVTPPGCHVCGELLDVHGRIGGFNFYWAWVTGRLAGLAAAGAVAPRAGKRLAGGKSVRRRSLEHAGSTAVQEVAGSVQ